MAGAALDDLRRHYGEAYLIELIGGRWVARRRDAHATMSAGYPDQLLDLIRPTTPPTRCPVIRARAGFGLRAGNWAHPGDVA